MNELNKQIRDLEVEILDRKNKEVLLERDLEKMKLSAKDSLDSKDKAFSTNEKREIYVLELENIKSIDDVLSKHKYDTKLKEIELRFLLRQLEILVHYLKQGVDLK